LLLIDTNILLRCSQGRAMLRLQALRAKGVRLATTDHNVDEFGRKLVQLFGWKEDEAWAEIERVLDAVHVFPFGDYEHQRRAADRRLGKGGESDWPALAAALALDSGIWSDDRDFFGVGVPVWSTANVQLAEEGPS
jgi:predicted nucleic acid-binding protein